MEKNKKGFFDYLDKAEDSVLIFAFIIIIALGTLQVVTRVIFNVSFSWTEELIRYIYIWMCWLGVSLAQRRKEHICLTFITDKFPKGFKKILNIILTIAILAFSAWLFTVGIQMVLQLTKTGAVSAGAKIPMYLVYLAFPVGISLYWLRLARDLFHQFRTLRKGVD